MGVGDAMTVLPLDKDSVRVRFPEHIAFAAGHVDLSPKIQALLDRLAITFQRPEVIEVQIEGHTDDKPTHGSQYPSNWELSAARAMSVFHALSRLGVPNGRMIAAGMGDKSPVPGHPELSRRVDITLKFRPVTEDKNDTSHGPMQKYQRPAIQQPKANQY